MEFFIFPYFQCMGICIIILGRVIKHHRLKWYIGFAENSTTDVCLINFNINMEQIINSLDINFQKIIKLTKYFQEAKINQADRNKIFCFTQRDLVVKLLIHQK